MPELVEQMYCSQQIVIPPKFPYTLKRYCKAAIKTQPYDLLRWSFEYFKAMAENRRPPVKLRLEYPIYSSEGGLTRGCLKVLAQQLCHMPNIPLPLVKRAWRGFCLDTIELVRIFCLCEVYKREETIEFLHFIAVAGGLLTKCLTNTMILLCETLTKEADGGSAAIPADDFFKMYQYLASIDASADVKYLGGYREGFQPPVEEVEEEVTVTEETLASISTDSFWTESKDLRHLAIINDKIDAAPKISTRGTLPLLGVIPRTVSVEIANKIERQNYLNDRRGQLVQNEDVERHLQKLSAMHLEGGPPPDEFKMTPKVEKPKPTVTEKDIIVSKEVKISVFDEDERPVAYEFYGEPIVLPEEAEEEETKEEPKDDQFENLEEEVKKEIVEEVKTEAQLRAEFVAQVLSERQERKMEMATILDQLTEIVDKYNSANYDLGMVAGRQMSTTSGEFIVQHIERDIMAYIDEQIAILPDPDLKKKRAKPEEVEMVRGILETFIEENMHIIVPEIEEVEEEEEPIPEINIVYAVPGIGPVVDEDIVIDFLDYAKEVSKDLGVIMPRNLRHYLCPPLEKYVEYYDKVEKEAGETHVVKDTQLKWGKSSEPVPIIGAFTV